MNAKQLQIQSIELVKAKAALAESQRLLASATQKVAEITEKISSSNEYSKDPDALINCGDLGLYHLKFHKETGALVAMHLIKNAVLESP